MPKLTIHVDGSGRWGHAYVSITSSSGVTDYAGLWPNNPNDPSIVLPGTGTIRGNEPIPNKNYDPTLPKVNPNPADTEWKRNPNSYESYPGDKQRYEKVHSPELSDTPRYDQDYNITEQQYQNLKNHINKAKSDPNYTVSWDNCTDFVQSVWEKIGFSGSFADNIPASLLAQMGFAGIWSWFWQKDIDVTGDLSGAWPNADGSYDLADRIKGAVMSSFPVTPIAFDLNGSGKIDTYGATNSLNKAFFDIDNDNFREKTQWLNPVDGWLAMDRNSDGKITNQRELFGDSDGKLAYQKLAELNSNNTGASANAITSADAAWGNLRVWVDSDVDGVSDAGELRTLDSLGITSISLESAAGSKKGTFLMNGVSRLTQDILLQVRQENSWYMGNASEIKPEALLLPLSRGYGDIKSMHFAASENATLMTQLREIANLPTVSLDSYYTKLQNMVYNWTGASGVATNPIYGQYVDTQHLFVVERFSGIGTGAYATQIETNWVVRSLAFRWNEGNDRENGYEDLISELAVRFAAQGPLKAVFGNPTYDFSTDKMVFSIPLAQILTNAKANVPSDNVDKNIYWSEIARTLKLYSSDLRATEATVKTQIDAAAGYNVAINNIGGRYFEGDADNNTLTGNANSNYLIGVKGADTLIGGKGDDFLQGGTGADTYRYASGDGNDYIFETTLVDVSSMDVLQFTNINRNSLTFSRADTSDVVQANGIGNDSLKISVAGGGSVLIRDHFQFDANTATNAYSRMEQIKFADGTAMDFAATKQATIRLTSGNDTVNGFSDAENLNGLAGNDLLRGFAGNDTLFGGIGNDTLEGGDGLDILRGDAGKDSLRGGNGNDTFVFNNIADNQVANADYINDFVRGTDKIDVRGLGFARLDTDGGLTEANELRVITNAGSTQTFTSDQNGFTFQLNSFATFTDSDFIWA